jgi:transcriptional regulator with XRE-family HTH domain
LLRAYRRRSCLSQDAIGRSVGYDHSFVSRLESGSRLPSRDTVLRLAHAMDLDGRDTDQLLASAGFLPLRLEYLLEEEPAIAAALAFLRDDRVPAERRDEVRTKIALVVRRAIAVADEHALARSV